MKVNDRKNQLGFTIVELMISTVVFSVVLLICLTGMVQVSRAYYKGITHSRTQEAARLLFEEITQTIQLSGSSITYLEPADSGPQIDAGDVADGTGVFCAGNKKYTYALDRKVVNGSPVDANKEIRNAIISEDIKCSDVLVPTPLNVPVSGTQRSLLGENMRITKFTITRVTNDPAVELKTGSQLWRVELSLAYGDQDLISYTDDSGAERVICEPGTGDEFCSIVELSTIVSRRIG